MSSPDFAGFLASGQPSAERELSLMSDGGTYEFEPLGKPK